MTVYERCYRGKFNEIVSDKKSLASAYRHSKENAFLSRTSMYLQEEKKTREGKSSEKGAKIIISNLNHLTAATTFIQPFDFQFYERIILFFLRHSSRPPRLSRTENSALVCS